MSQNRTKALAATASLLLPILTGCGPSKAEQEATFGKHCLASGFNGAQCGILWEQRERAEEAANLAFLSAILASSAAQQAAIQSSSSSRRK